MGVHGGAKLLDLIATGNAASFEDAKAQAEALSITCTLNDIKTWRPEPQAKAGLRRAFMKRFPRALPR
jgi:hypothetical protein